MASKKIVADLSLDDAFGYPRSGSESEGHCSRPGALAANFHARTSDLTLK